MGHYLWMETAIAFASTSVLAGLSLMWATSQFQQEAVIFRHAEDVRWSPFRRRRVAQLGPYPTPGNALLLVMVVIILLFQLQLYAAEWGIAKTLLVTELFIILLLPLLLLYRGGYDVPRVLSLRLPHASAWPATLFFMLGGWLLAIELAGLQHFLLPFPDELLEQFADLFAALNAAPIAYALFLVGILPGVCEELLCRGYLLSAFRPRFGVTGGVILAAIMFALLHMNPYRLVPTLWLGLLLGLIVVHTGSIFPAMFAHALNNILSFLVEKNQDWIAHNSWLSLEDSALLPWPIVALGVLLVVTGFMWIRKLSVPSPSSPNSADPATQETVQELDHDGIS